MAKSSFICFKLCGSVGRRRGAAGQLSKKNLTKMIFLYFTHFILYWWFYYKKKLWCKLHGSFTYKILYQTKQNPRLDSSTIYIPQRVSHSALFFHPQCFSSFRERFYISVSFLLWADLKGQTHWLLTIILGFLSSLTNDSICRAW
jgi:hypothetical protein